MSLVVFKNRRFAEAMLDVGAAGSCLFGLLVASLCCAGAGAFCLPALPTVQYGSTQYCGCVRASILAACGNTHSFSSRCTEEERLCP